MVKKPPAWTVQESMAAAKRLHKRFPDWVLSPCRVCGTWCVETPELGDRHSTCIVDKKKVNDDQGTMF